MPNRQKLYISLAVSAGVCAGIGLFLYVRHRRQLPSSKTASTNDCSSPIKSRRGRQHTDISTSAEGDQNESESVRFKSGNVTIEVDLPGANTIITPEQAIVLTGYLDDNYLNNEDKLQRVLTTIANLATFEENQINLINAGCIERLRQLLSSAQNETTQCKVLLALNNLALSNHGITHFSNIVSIVIHSCRTTPSKSSLRLYGLNLLINMSVLEYLHDEYRKDIHELGLLVASSWESNEEALSAGKILVNLSANKFNVTTLLKLTGIELKTVVNMCTPTRKSLDQEQLIQFEDILLRYLTFYCNMAETIVNELNHETENSIVTKSWLIDPVPHRQGAVYFELFDHDKQILIKSILRPPYSSNTIANQMKRLRQAMDTIRQIQFESSMSSLSEEFNDNDHVNVIADSSTPKKPMLIDHEHFLEDLDKQVTEQFDDDDDTILAGQSSPSDQSLASFRSAYSTNETNPSTSPQKSDL